MLNLVLLALVLGFVAWEVLANWQIVNGRTLSEWIWAFEDFAGWSGQVLVGLACLALFAHLVLRWN